MSDILTILGSGVAGLCVATALAGRGVPVVVSDPNGAAGPHGCSWWAGGMLAPECESETAEEPVVRLGRLAADWWEAQSVPVARQGSLVLALGRDRQELDRFSRRTARHQMVNKEELIALEPDLGERFGRALYFAQEAHIDPRHALGILRAGLESKGVRFETSVSTSQNIVDCRGLVARDVLSDLRGVKGEMLVLRCPDVQLSRPVRLLHPRFPLYIVPRGDGVFMLGATQIESGDRQRATVRSVMELLNTAYALHPAFAEAEILEIGVDARPAFPDNLPRITKIESGISVNGLFRHGYLLAPALAEMAADYLTQGTLPEFWKDAA